MKDNHTKLGTLRTLTIQDFAADEFAVGTYSVEVTVETALLMASPDKRGLVTKTIAAHLANSIQETTVPSHLWYFETAPKIVKAIPSFPEVMPFGQ